MGSQSDASLHVGHCLYLNVFVSGLDIPKAAIWTETFNLRRL